MIVTERVRMKHKEQFRRDIQRALRETARNSGLFKRRGLLEALIDNLRVRNDLLRLRLESRRRKARLLDAGKGDAKERPRFVQGPLVVDGEIHATGDVVAFTDKQKTR